MRIHKKSRIFIVVLVLALGVIILKFIAQFPQRDTSENQPVPTSSDTQFETPRELIFNPEGSKVTQVYDAETGAETTTIILNGSKYTLSLLHDAYASELANGGWNVLTNEIMSDQADITAMRGGEAVAIRIAHPEQDVYVYVVYKAENNI